MQKFRQILGVVILAWLLPACSSLRVADEPRDAADVAIVDLAAEVDSSPETAPQLETQPAEATPDPEEPPATAGSEPDQPPVAAQTDSIIATDPSEDEQEAEAGNRGQPARSDPQPGVLPAAPAPESKTAKAAGEPPAPAAEVAAPAPEPDPAQQPKPPAQSQPAPPRAEPAPAPDMDMEKLETRLRKTKAIGLFTKLELKSQVDELLEEVQDYHEAKSKLSLDQLEERFNLLVMKLMILLQDDDPQLHREIARARPVLWTTLADPVQFSTLKGP